MDTPKYMVPTTSFPFVTVWTFKLLEAKTRSLPCRANGLLITNRSDDDLHMHVHHPKGEESISIVAPEGKATLIEPHTDIKLSYKYLGGTMLGAEGPPSNSWFSFDRFLSIDEVDSIIAPAEVQHLRGAFFSAHDRKIGYAKRTPFGVAMFLSGQIEAVAHRQAAYDKLVPQSWTRPSQYNPGTYIDILKPVNV